MQAEAELSAERDRVIDQIYEGLKSGALSEKQFESLLARAHRAADVAELSGIESEIPAPPPEPGQAEKQALAVVERRFEVSKRADHPKVGHTLALLGRSQREGVWRVPKEMRAFACLGNNVLDFREAVFAPGVTEVWIAGVLGGAHVLVPPDLQVECHGTAILGGFDSAERTADEPTPEMPTVRVRGLVVLGSVEVEVRFPGESKREAKRRRRRERREEKKRLRKLKRLRG